MQACKGDHDSLNKYILIKIETMADPDFLIENDYIYTPNTQIN
jgi:hypothetical protein